MDNYISNMINRYDPKNIEESLKNSYKLKNSQKSCYLSDFRLFSFSPKR